MRASELMKSIEAYNQKSDDNFNVILFLTGYITRRKTLSVPNPLINLDEFSQSLNRHGYTMPSKETRAYQLVFKAWKNTPESKEESQSSSASAAAPETSASTSSHLSHRRETSNRHHKHPSHSSKDSARRKREHSSNKQRSDAEFFQVPLSFPSGAAVPSHNGWSSGLTISSQQGGSTNTVNIYAFPSRASGEVAVTRGVALASTTQEFDPVTGAPIQVVNAQRVAVVTTSSSAEHQEEEVHGVVGAANPSGP